MYVSKRHSTVCVIQSNMQAAFRRACANGNLELAQSLRYEPRVRVSADDNIALREACAGGHVAVVTWLLTQDGVCVSSAGFQALKNLAARDALPLLRIMWVRALQGPLAHRDRIDIMELVLKLVDTAVTHHHFDTARFFLTECCCWQPAAQPAAQSPEWTAALIDVHAQSFWNVYVTTRSTALHWAAESVWHVPWTPALDVVVKEALRQEAFRMCAARGNVPALDMLCAISQQPLRAEVLDAALVDSPNAETSAFVRQLKEAH